MHSRFLPTPARTLLRNRRSHVVLRHVVVATDDSRGVARSIGADVTVVTVEHGDAPPPVERVPPLPLTRSSRLRHELDAGVTMTDAAAIRETVVSIRQGRPVYEILAEITEQGTNALAFGCHRGGPSGILKSGGTARHLLHSPPVSVLTIPL
jgi:nucleotide-binding universal stress UspA family protein